MDTFSALAAPTRRRIVEILAEHGELAATAIWQKFNLSSPAISQHLKILKEAKIIVVRRQGKQRIYDLDRARIAEIEKWACDMNTKWDSRFDALDQALQHEHINNKR
jgi:DNA-binding transcriptional ArsR family regulator